MRFLAVRFLGAMLFGLGVVSALSWLGMWHHASDLLSHFRFHFAVASGIAALFCILVSRRLALAALMVMLANVAGAAIYPYAPSSPYAGGQRIKVVTINLLHRAGNIDDVVALVRDEVPDLIFLQELSYGNRSILTRLRGSHPWQVSCIKDDDGCDTAILSRFPWNRTGGKRLPDRTGSVAWASLGAKYGHLKVASVHLRWPFFSDQDAQLRQVSASLPSHPGPVLLAGDFNAAAWSGVLRRFLRVTGLRPAGAFQPTWPVRSYRTHRDCILCFPQLQIDHVLVSPSIRVLSRRAGRDVGSDHLPLFAELELPRSSQRAARTRHRSNGKTAAH